MRKDEKGSLVLARDTLKAWKKGKSLNLKWFDKLPEQKRFLIMEFIGIELQREEEARKASKVRKSGKES